MAGWTLPTFPFLWPVPLQTAGARAAPLMLPAPTPVSAALDTITLTNIAQRLTNIETLLQRSARAAGAPLVTSENLVMAVILTGTVAVGTELEVDVEFTDLLGNRVEFAHLSITEVDIAAPGLVNADDVRLRLFRAGRRRVPQDLAVELTGSSLIAATWQASFSNRRLEYSDLDGESELHVSIRNTAGNSGPGTFQLRFYARAFPKAQS